MSSREPLEVVAAALAAVALLAGCGTGEPAPSPSPPVSQQDCSALKNLAVLAWADHAGIVPQDRSLAGWLAENPGRDALLPLPTDAPVDVVAVWQQREDRPDPWNDLVTYQQNDGVPWLLETGLDEVVPVLDGQPGPDPSGWRSCG